ncbi:MAG: NAD(P)/FAD-dependent oxidoreductase [Candidatus Limnocylindria bacterium]
MRSSVDVAVIGGGIIGCSAAAMLAARGARVALFEASGLGAGASGRNLGAIQHPFDPVLAPLYRGSLELYRGLAEEDGAFAVPVTAAGLLLLSRDPAAARAQAAALAGSVPELAPAFLDAGALAEAEPSLVRGLAACRLETGFPIPPGSATAAWARLAERHGAQLEVGREARPVIDGGRVVGVRLAGGSHVATGSVLVAAGPWSPQLVDPSGGWAPIHRTWGVTVQLRLGEAAPRHIVEEDQVDVVNRPLIAAPAAEPATGTRADPPSLFSIASAGGVSTLGSTFLSGEPDGQRLSALLLRRGSWFLPAIGSAEVVAVRSCARPQSMDGRPFIGPVAGAAGLFVCAGHGPWGISTGPASAALAVGSILDGAPVPERLTASRAPAAA